MTTRRRVRVVSAEIQRGGCWLLAQRAAHAELPLLWEFPGGRVRRGETDVMALSRALRERLCCEGSIGELVMEIVHPYSSYDLALAVYRCDLGTATTTPGKVAALAWVPADQFVNFTFPGADQKTIDLLLSDDVTGERPPTSET
jgi:8-oxo-dGTP diphosphatase